MILDNPEMKDSAVENAVNTAAEYSHSMICATACNSAYIDEDDDDGFFQELFEDIAEHGQRAFCNLMCGGIDEDAS